MLGGTQPRCAFSALCPVLGPGLGPERMKCRNEANGPSFRRRTTKAVQRFVSCGREDTKRLVFKPAIADRAPSGASPRVDHYCLPVRESQFARPVGWSPPAAGVLLALGRRRGRCLDPRARPPGGAVRNRGPARAGFASRVPRVVRRFCGFFWTCRRGPAGAARAGRAGARAVGRCDVRATCENDSASMHHELLYVWHDCCMGDSSSGLPVARAYRQ